MTFSLACLPCLNGHFVMSCDDDGDDDDDDYLICVLSVLNLYWMMMTIFLTLAAVLRLFLECPGFQTSVVTL